MSLLMIRVKKAVIRNFGKNNTTSNATTNFTSYCVLKIESAKGQTSLQYGFEPVWNQEFLFELAAIGYDLIIEVWQKGMLWDSIIGMMYIPLKKVRHSSRDNGPGKWYRLSEDLDWDSTANRVIGTTNPTDHEVMLDIRFELPSELSEAEALILQEKLDYMSRQNELTPSWAVDLYGIASKRKEQLQNNNQHDRLSCSTEYMRDLASHSEKEIAESFRSENVYNRARDTARTTNHNNTPNFDRGRVGSGSGSQSYVCHENSNSIHDTQSVHSQMIMENEQRRNFDQRNQQNLPAGSLSHKNMNNTNNTSFYPNAAKSNTTTQINSAYASREALNGNIPMRDQYSTLQNSQSRNRHPAYSSNQYGDSNTSVQPNDISKNSQNGQGIISQSSTHLENNIKNQMPNDRLSAPNLNNPLKLQPRDHNERIEGMNTSTPISTIPTNSIPNTPSVDKVNNIQTSSQVQKRLQETTEIANSTGRSNKENDKNQDRGRIPTLNTTDENYDTISERISPARYRWLTAINKVKNQIKEERRKGENILDDPSGVLKDRLAVDIMTGDPFAQNPGGLGGLKRKASVPMFSDISAALITRRSRVSVLASYAKINTRNRRLRQSTYLTTLSALVYPVSSTTPHNFTPCTTAKPVWCDECNGILYGLIRHGLKCDGCGIICHDRCRDMLNDDCLQRAAEKSASKKSKKAGNEKYESQANTIYQTIKKMMEDRISKDPDVFSMMQKSFEVNQNEHDEYIGRAKEKILSGSSQWKVTIKLTVHSAQGLYAKDKNGMSDPYVTVQIGTGTKAKKFKTKTIHQNLNPKWEETFSFFCQNSSDRIKVRVWDEDNDLKSQIKAKFKRESDDFLGQTIIEVKMLSGEMDTWYNLEKRTDKSVVSGAIRLKTSLTTETDDENQPASYSYCEQYKCLHNIIFSYIVDSGGQLGDMGKNKISDFGNFFEGHAEEAVAEYALRYGVDPIFQALTHFSCLATKYRDLGMSQQMSLLLLEINQYFAKSRKKRNQIGSTDVPGVSSKSDSDDPMMLLNDSSHLPDSSVAGQTVASDAQTMATHNTIGGETGNTDRTGHVSGASEHVNKISCRNAFAATKFDPDAFGKILEHLHNSIRIDLSMFRTVFRYDDPTQKSLEELKHKIDLLKQITFFRANILSLSTIPAVETVQACVHSCMKSAYNFIFNNCDKMLSDHNKSKNTSKNTTSELDPTDKETGTSSGDNNRIEDETRSTTQTNNTTIGPKDTNESTTNRSDSPFKGPSMNNLDFWMSLVGLVAQVMNEVKTHYSEGFNQFDSEFDIAVETSCQLFQLMQNDIQDAMLDHCNQRIKEKSLINAGQRENYTIPNSSYMSLQFRIKWLYSGFVIVNKEKLETSTNDYGIMEIQMFGGGSNCLAIEYPLYFEQFTTDWLEEMVPISTAFVKAAYEKDRRNDFMVTNDSVLHSNSVLDIFSVINQNMDILKRLESPIKETHDKYFYLFSVNINHVLKGDFL